MGLAEFKCMHLYTGMVSVIHIFVAFSVLAKLIHSEPIPCDVSLEFIIYIIHTHDLALLLGRCYHNGNDVEDVVCKRAPVNYDHEGAECSVMTDWFCHLTGHSRSNEAWWKSSSVIWLTATAFGKNFLHVHKRCFAAMFWLVPSSRTFK